MNVPIFLIAIFFSLIINDYFGWNMFPHSDAELICDGIVMILAALSLKK